jgi:FkbM family methyltransferase
LKEIKIGNSDNSIFVDEEDLKGNSLIRHKGITQPRVVNFWRKIVKDFDPDIILDVGLNYGEILFSTNYKNSAKIFGIEPNINLRPYIKESIKKHINNKQISIYYKMASDKTLSHHSFYLDNERSGNSSIFNLPERQQTLIKTKSIKIDDLMTIKQVNDKLVLFKIDVEGCEWKVLKGMETTLKSCKQFIGCIEFNLEFLTKVDVNVLEFIKYLKNNFKIYHPTEEGVLIEVIGNEDFFEQENFSNDLVIFPKN